MEREALYERINARVDIMLDEGLLSEVRNLIDMGYEPSLKPMKSLGYRHMVEFIQETMSYKTNAIYAVLQLPETGLAVGRTEMPRLPSSRAALLTSPTSTDTMSYPDMIDQSYDTDAVITGQVGFTLNVRQP